MFLAFWLLAAMAGPSPSSLDAPRRNLVACLKQFEAKSIAAKMMPDDFVAALSTACEAERSALSEALIAYDVGMGSKRAAAIENAKLDVDDYVAGTEERYRDRVKPAH